MSLVNITNIIFENQVVPFLTPITMHITFELLKPLQEEIFWKFYFKLVYIGSPTNEMYDQVLDSFSMGPLSQVGTMQFTIQTNPPNHLQIPTKDDLLGVTALMLQVFYKKREFFRVGYFVYNGYIDPELIENDPVQPIIDCIYRQVDPEKARITRFNIDWENDEVFQSKMISNHDFMFSNQQPLNEMTNQQLQSQFMGYQQNQNNQGLYKPNGQLPNENQMMNNLF